MRPDLAAAIEVARELAWYPIANGTARNSWYFRRREAHEELRTRLATVKGLSANASPQLVALVAAMRRTAAATFCNRQGPPYYARRTAVLQLRGAFAVYDEECRFRDRERHARSAA